ncbi:MAG TPA: endolytic transglycosylase MltG [Ktedonobacterales bacterium]|nr:endolytic transglycosylase MltG [Ktedonobacterales bacterium]
MKKAGLVAFTVIFSLLAFAVGFGGATGALMLSQPSVSGSTTTINFIVNKNDSTAAVAARLEKAGLIRNALVFRFYARQKHLDTSIEPGLYKLSPNMSMVQIITALQKGKPDETVIKVLDGLRVLQYPTEIQGLKNFNADNFIKIATTGNWMDGTPVNKDFWFVAPKAKNATAALEGYLYPDTYFMDPAADETEVIKRMLGTLGEHLCPGPTNNPDAAGEYFSDKAQCRQHATTVKVGSKDVNIFDAMNAAYFTKDDVVGLYDSLTVASITARERGDNVAAVANVFHNRYLELLGKSGGVGDTAGFFQADSTVQYARDTDKPPAVWPINWPPLAGAAAKDISPNNPYNTYTHKGLTPGPIAAPIWDLIVAAATPKSPKDFPYFYFLHDKCGKTYLAKDNADFQANAIPHINDHNC